jgi:hypothetical protein
VNAAVDEFGEDRVLNSIGNKLGTSITALGTDIEKWIESGNSEEDIRTAVGDAAKNTLNGWFKNITAGQRLGEIVISVLDDISGTSLQQTISQVEGWIYGG